MGRRPLIGVTTQTLQAIDGIPADLPASWVMNQRYARAVARVGGVPVLVPLLADDADTLRAIYDRLDGVLVPGGVDIDPAAYREAPHPLLGRTDAARDATELLLARWAVAEEKPFLGLCRGLQVLSVAMGGTLWQDLARERPGSARHDYFPDGGFTRDYLAHDVDITHGSRLGEALGGGSITVNSMHHQGIRELGRGLTATAIASDGLIEGAEFPDQRFAVGVQWHPEAFDEGPAVGELFRQFVAAAGEERREKRDERSSRR
ncbi:MAG TPA: gamma-glutamyl-gamma-aminobutyrate hydrolase family protein [Gemmatimonadales bacterium]|jgi:putative glutamine amidotransferase